MGKPHEEQKYDWQLTKLTWTCNMLQTVKSVSSFDNVAMSDDKPHQIRMFKTNILFASLAVYIYMFYYCEQSNKSINMLKYKIVM